MVRPEAESWTPPPAESVPPRSQDIAARYRISRKLASGGMGVVFLATDLLLERAVALKLMSQECATAEAALRFEREAKAAARLGGATEYAVQILDYGIDQGAPFIVMELLEGEDLATRIGRRGALSLEELNPIVYQLSRALKKVHRMGLVHRDLKPENVFLSRHEDEEEQVKILDFGIVMDLGGHKITRSGQLLGTLWYMSPEQLRGHVVDARTDLWAFGVLLYQALTGRLPFDSSIVGNLLINICTEPLVPPSEVAEGLSPAVDAFFARALQRDPAERFQSADELARAFLSLTRESLPPPSSTGGPPSSAP